MEKVSLQKPSRNTGIDALKGCAILLVVIGHAIQYSLGVDFQNPVYRIIYSFHMPLFFAISGFLAFGSLNRKQENFLMMKFEHLLVPFFFWGFFVYLFIVCIPVFDLHLDYPSGPIDYLRLIVLDPGRGLWFLWILFFCFMVCYLVIRLLGSRNRAALALIMVAIALFAVYYLTGFSLTEFYFMKMAVSFPFFLGGYLYCQYREKIGAYRKPLVLVSIICFPMLMYLGWSTWAINDWVIGKTISTAALRFVLQTTAIISVSSVVLFICEFVKPRWLVWLGTVTLDIYATHQLFLNFAMGEGVVKVAMAIALGLSGSIVLSLIVRRSNLLAKIAYGTNIKSGKTPVPLAPGRHYQEN